MTINYFTYKIYIYYIRMSHTLGCQKQDDQQNTIFKIQIRNTIDVIDDDIIIADKRYIHFQLIERIKKKTAIKFV